MKLTIDLSRDELDLLALALADKSGDTLRGGTANYSTCTTPAGY